MNKGTHNGGFRHGERMRKTVKSRNFEESVDAMDDAMDDLFNINVWRPAFRRFWESRGLEEPEVGRVAIIDF